MNADEVYITASYRVFLSSTIPCAIFFVNSVHRFGQVLINGTVSRNEYNRVETGNPVIAVIHGFFIRNWSVRN